MRGRQESVIGWRVACYWLARGGYLCLPPGNDSSGHDVYAPVNGGAQRRRVGWINAASYKRLSSLVDWDRPDDDTALSWGGSGPPIRVATMRPGDEVRRVMLREQEAPADALVSY